MEIKSRKHLMKTLISLGLTQEQAELYLIIMQSSETGVSNLAREMYCGRTKVYRILNELKELNLINEVHKQYGSVYTAKSYNNLQSLIEVKAAELQNLKKSFDGLKDYFTEESEKDPFNQKVITYHGMDGLKQVIWNTTKADRVLKVFEVSRLNVFMDFGFSEDVRMQYLKNGIKTKDITNESFINGWTNNQEFVDKCAQCHYISPEEFELSFEIYIYNDVVTLIDYRHNDKLFCIEIYNKFLKLTMEQLFDFVWDRTKEMVVTGERGQMEVKE